MHVSAIYYANDNRTVRGTIRGANPRGLLHRVISDLTERGILPAASVTTLTDHTDTLADDASKIGITVIAIREHVRVTYLDPYDLQSTYNNYTAGNLLGYFIVNPIGTRTYEFEYTIFDGLPSLANHTETSAPTIRAIDTYYARSELHHAAYVRATRLLANPTLVS